MNKLTVSLATLAFAAAFTVACATTQPMGQQVSDSWITSKVKSKLAADPEVNPFEIDVDTNDGVVRLSGVVESESDRREAEQIARDTDGVKRVVNQIDVGERSMGAQMSDAGITSKVKAKLAADPQVTAMNVDVDTIEGVVTLTGLVRTEDQKVEAEELARATDGVKDVRNLLEVQGDER